MTSTNRENPETMTKWQPISACTQCGSPFLAPDLTTYTSFVPPPVKKTCRCLNGPVKNVLDALGVGAGLTNLLLEWRKGLKDPGTPKP